MRLRIKPGDVTIIQKLDCDGNWVDWYGEFVATQDTTARMRTSIAEQIGTAAGAPQHDRVVDTGSCVEYDLILQGNNQTILPITVSAGDTITITNARGQVSENVGILGVVAEYYPPSGATDLADSTYPANGLRKMRLIMSIGGTWYDAYNVIAFTVPDGVSQDNLVFMVNDTEISDNLGTIYFHIQVCRGVSSEWTRVLDFRESQWSSVAFDGHGAWTLGTGWRRVPGDGTPYSCEVGWNSLSVSPHITSLRCLFTTDNTSSIGEHADFEVVHGGTDTVIIDDPGLALTPGGELYKRDDLDVVTFIACSIIGGPATITIQKITITGIGPIPSQWEPF